MCYDQNVKNRKDDKKLRYKKKVAAQIALLITGAAMLCFGAWRGEAATVLSKAIKLCLECVGNWIRKFQVYHSLCPVFGAGSRQAQLY